MSATSLSQKIFIIALLAGSMVSQYVHDAHIHQNGGIPTATAVFPSPQLIKLSDLGLNSAVAAYYWNESVMGEVASLPLGLDQFKQDVAFIHALEPKLSFPYYWTAWILPGNVDPKNVDYRIVDFAIQEGELGIQQGALDWRTPFAVGTLYELYYNDLPHAAQYYALIARDPAAPDYIKRFGQNFGIAAITFNRTEQGWIDLAHSTTDPTVKSLAVNYVARLKLFDLLNQKVALYRHTYGKLPATLNDLVNAHLMNSVPTDPLGFQFQINADGTVGIKK